MKFPVQLFIILNSKAAEPFQKAFREIVGLPPERFIAEAPAPETAAAFKVPGSLYLHFSKPGKHLPVIAGLLLVSCSPRSQGIQAVIAQVFQKHDMLVFIAGDDPRHADAVLKKKCSHINIGMNVIPGRGAGHDNERGAPGFYAIESTVRPALCQGHHPAFLRRACYPGLLQEILNFFCERFFSLHGR